MGVWVKHFRAPGGPKMQPPGVSFNPEGHPKWTTHVHEGIVTLACCTDINKTSEKLCTGPLLHMVDKFYTQLQGY